MNNQQNNSLQPFNPSSIAVPNMNELHSSNDLQAFYDFVRTNQLQIAKLSVRECTIEFSSAISSQVVAQSRFSVADSKSEVSDFGDISTIKSKTTTRSSKRTASKISNPAPARRVYNRLSSDTNDDSPTTSKGSKKKGKPTLSKANSSVPKKKSELPTVNVNERSSTTAQNNVQISKGVVILTDYNQIKDVAPGTWYKVKSESELNITGKCDFDDSSSDENEVDDN